MADYRVDELARAAGATVRNVRAYQDRGLLPPPRRDGRVGIYSDAHLARLRLIGQLLERGYALAHIGELLAAWESGRDVAAVLGLEAAIASPWSDEIPGYVTRAELILMYGDADPDAAIARSVELGILEPDGDRFRVPSPRLLHAGAELVAAGIPLPAVLDLAADIGAGVGRIAARLVEVVAGQLLAGRDADWRPTDAELPDMAALIARLRPLAQMAVDAQLAKAMEREVRAALGEHLAHAAGQPAREEHAL